MHKTLTPLTAPTPGLSYVNPSHGAPNLADWFPERADQPLMTAGETRINRRHSGTSCTTRSIGSHPYMMFNLRNTYACNVHGLYTSNVSGRRQMLFLGAFRLCTVAPLTYTVDSSAFRWANIVFPARLLLSTASLDWCTVVFCICRPRAWDFSSA